MKAPVLEVQGIHKRFTLHLRGGLVLPVLEGLSLQVHAGECLGLTGPSGRGKSTLMKCLYGSYGVDAGALWFEGEGGVRTDLASASPQTLLALRRREIGHVSQFLRVLPRQSTLDVVAERLLQARPATDTSGSDAAALSVDPLDDGPFEAQRAEAHAEVRRLLARLNLPETLWALPPATFSGGEQQRVNVARGFIVPARLLLLDEPTASLDAMNRQVVIRLIHEAKANGSAVVGIFHDDEVREAVADRCIEVGANAA